MEVSVGESIPVGDSVITIVQVSEQDGHVRLGLTHVGGSLASSAKKSVALTIIENVRVLCSMLGTFVGRWVASRSTTSCDDSNRTSVDVSEVQKD
jgi:hypothetical protein